MAAGGTAHGPRRRPDRSGGAPINTNVNPVVVLFAFANDRAEGVRYLRNLPEEQRQVREAMAAAEAAGHCQVAERANATVDQIFDLLQNPQYRDRVAIFHYGGHAGGAEIILETPAGQPTTAHAAGLAAFLGEQRGLELVFLNGCSSRGQVRGLLDAGVPAVIATSQAIDDTVATEFSARFYKSLAGGAPIRTAFNEAQAAVRTRLGDQPRGSYRSLIPEAVIEDRWPWELYVADGAAEHLDKWSLPLAASDPLFGLPAPPVGDLPLSPCKHLHWFTRDDAEVFFGRGREIRDLYEAVTAPDGAPIVLLFGATGVGKSSLLDAGLRPRLEANCEAVYLRRDGALGLVGTLAGIFATAASPAPSHLSAGWRQREAATGRPLVVILDQLEEAYTRPLAGSGEEMAELMEVLRRLFAVRETRPRGKILLAFRKEWLAEILGLLDAGKLPRTRVEIKHLGRDGIIEAIEGPASTERLVRHYRLEVEPGLAGIVADDLLEDRAAAVAPALQILLTKMWGLATKANAAAPRFTVELYQGLKRRGLLLDDFVEEQLDGLRQWRPELVSSGLALGLLAHHTTPLGTAETRQAAAVVERYGGRSHVVELIQQCKDRYLLTGTVRAQEGELVGDPNDPEDKGTTRLAHDTLAPIIRRRFEASDLPGQRAVRILDQRSVEWLGGKEGPPLDEVDLAIVEQGQSGMRARTVDEERLLSASRRRRELRARRRRSLRQLAAAAVVVIAGLGGVAAWQWYEAEEERRRAVQAQQEAEREKEAAEQERQKAVEAEQRAQDRARVAIASNLLEKESTEANLLLLEVRNPDETPTAVAMLHKALAAPLDMQPRERPGGIIEAASFSSDGTRVVTASSDKAARIWDTTTGELLATLDRHTDSVRAVSFSPDDTRVVTAFENKARIWDTTTGEVVATFDRHTDSVQAVSFSPDGTRVVTASTDRTARIWDVATGAELATLRGHARGITTASFNPDASRVLTASSDATARLWNVATGEQLATFSGHEGSVRGASFSPDGSRVVTISTDTTARIWNVATSENVVTLSGHTDSVHGASFSPDGARLLTVSADTTARLWDAATGEELATLPQVSAASFSPDGNWVVTASFNMTAQIWDAATGRMLLTNENHMEEQIVRLTEPEYARAVWLSPDGTRVVTIPEVNPPRIWHVAVGQQLATLKGHTDKVRTASFSPDGTRIVTTSRDATARIWDAATGEELATLGHAEEVGTASFSPDGTRVVTASYMAARIWDAATGEKLATLEGHTKVLWDTSAAVSFSPDGTRVVTGSTDTTGRIWDVATGAELATLEGHTSWVTAASFSPDGTRVVTGSQDTTARIWDAGIGEELVALMGHTEQVTAASFSPDGTRVVTASKDTTARIWDVATGEELFAFAGHEDRVWTASFSPDGTRVVTASSDRTARIWEAATGEEVVALMGHQGWVDGASFSPDGTRVVTTSDDLTARLWDAATGQELATFKAGDRTAHDDPDRWVRAAFSPDGTRVVTASSDTTARIWPSSTELLLGLIRARTQLCLDGTFRHKTLGEPSPDAKRNEEACKSCVPVFFGRFKSASPKDWSAYVEAWGAYKECLDKPH